MKKSLIVKGSGGAGIGDKIRALVVAVMYCQITGRSIYIDWRDRTYGDTTTNYFDDLFSVNGLAETENLPNRGTVLPASWRSRLQMSLDEVVEADNFLWVREEGIKRYSFDQTKFDYEADHLVMWEMDQFYKVREHYHMEYPQLRSLQREQFEAEIFSNHFKVCDDVVLKVNEFVKNIFPEEAATIGVHFRLTDESQRSRLNPEISEYVKAVRKVIAHSPNAKIFLATDNISIIEEFITQFGKSKVVTHEKWLPQAGEHLHKNSLCPDQLQSAKDALVDAYLLGKCDWLISSGVSSFSWLARILSKTDQSKQIILMPRLSIVQRVRHRINRTYQKLMVR